MHSFSPSTFFENTEELYPDIWKTPVWETLACLETFLSSQKLGNIEVPIPEGVILENISTISIGKGTIIEPGSFIRGPCIIGENCSIRQGAYIRGFLLTGKGCVIGHATEVKHSILLDRVQAAHFAYIGDSILGNDVNLGAGTICANFRFDGKIISIHGEQKMPTGLKKLGAILGDGVKIGCNAVINPGTLIGKGSYIFPCLHVQDVIPSNSVVKPIDKCTIVPRK